MIRLHAFANMFPGGVGETKDMRIQWALEEMGLPYEVRAWDYLGGETHTPEFAALSPFGQIPVLEHDDLVVAESGAILLHLAEVSGGLIPADAAGRRQVLQWCFAAAATVAWPMAALSMVDAGMMGQDRAARDFAVGLARRWLSDLERRLDGRDWIVADQFTIADIMLVHTLRDIRHNDLLAEYPQVRAYSARALARPAWQRTRRLTAERMSVEIDAIA